MKPKPRYYIRVRAVYYRGRSRIPGNNGAFAVDYAVAKESALAFASRSAAENVVRVLALRGAIVEPF